MSAVLSDLRPVDYSADSGFECYECLRDDGFLVLKNHPVDYGLVSETYSAWQAFFENGNKQGFEFDEQAHDGYVAASLSECAVGSKHKDLKSFYHYYTWGRCPAYLKNLTETLYWNLNEVAENLLTKISAHLPSEVLDKISEPLSGMAKNCKRTLFRPIYYPAMTGNETPGAERAAAHTDINLLTLIPSATAAGLQVQAQDGSWRAVPCDPNYMIVNVGDMLQECTGHHLRSTIHRVVNPSKHENKPRISMPLFLHARSEVQLSDRYTAQSYREERWGELGLKTDATK
jgi:isopenicillin N synthase-like dioxygenase